MAARRRSSPAWAIRVESRCAGSGTVEDSGSDAARRVASPSPGVHGEWLKAIAPEDVAAARFHLSRRGGRRRAVRRAGRYLYLASGVVTSLSLLPPAIEPARTLEVAPSRDQTAGGWRSSSRSAPGANSPSTHRIGAGSLAPDSMLRRISIS